MCGAGTGTPASPPRDRDGFQQPCANSHTSERHREAQIPLQLPWGRKAPWEGSPGRGEGPMEGCPCCPPSGTAAPAGPPGIPGEGAGKQVFVNSSRHMHEKRQAPAAQSLATGKNKIQGPPRQPHHTPPPRDPGGTESGHGARTRRGCCAPASSQDGSLPSSEGQPCEAGPGLAPSHLGAHGLEGSAALRESRRWGGLQHL